MRATLLNQLTRSWNVHRIRRRLKPAVTNAYSGEFSTFEEAHDAIPPRGLVGYDNTEHASWYRERLDQVQSEDYPALFWLERLLTGIETVFDFGGHIGLHYYAWSRMLTLPESVKWKVCEVAAVADAGRALAQQRGVDQQLTFTTDAAEAAGASLFIASGSLQYLEPGFLWRALGSLRLRPRHLLLNKLPVHARRDYVTVQDTGASFHPYTVVSRATLDAELHDLGYHCLDTWKTAGLECRPALRPELDVPDYSGGCWVLRSN
ncbi:MAG: methyltransferase, TIGR04325 family [Archangiaceae bacterium]|nr:methyltransferase, TIGR04325 family [Archangiaceae bacterium]